MRFIRSHTDGRRVQDRARIEAQFPEVAGAGTVKAVGEKLAEGLGREHGETVGFERMTDEVFSSVATEEEMGGYHGNLNLV